MEIEIVKEAPQDFLTFLASSQTNEVEKLYTFAMDSLVFADKIHTYHWSCQSGFQHTQFENLYDCIRDFADKLVETVLSMGVPFKLNSKTYNMNDEIFDLGNALVKIEAYRDELEKRTKFSSPHLRFLCIPRSASRFPLPAGSDSG